MLRMSGWMYVLVGCAFVGGCKTIYVPNVVNAPLLTQKHDVRANISSNNLQAAYAVTDHVGVMVNGQHQSSSEEGGSSATTGAGTLGELGAGYFAPMNRWLQMEVYGGAGYGRVEHKNWETVGGVRSDYGYAVKATKLFLQPSVGITRDWFDVALSTRLVFLHPYDATSTNYSEQRLRDDHLFGVDKGSFTFAEPAITVRGGYKWAKLFFQVGRSFKLVGVQINRDETFLNAGLSVAFSPRY